VNNINPCCEQYQPLLWTIPTPAVNNTNPCCEQYQPLL
jgi:hypothetical protein